MSKKISDLINEINEELYLPSIQREFVWLNNRKEERIQKLFDSIMQNYPIGNIMVWRVKKEPGKDLPFTTYKFIENYSDSSTNEEVRLDRVAKPGLILDGQQRLTSLLIGLRGSYSYLRYNQLYETRLYLNLFGDLEDNPDNTYGLKYEFDFLTSREPNFLQEAESTSKFWFSVGSVLAFAEQDSETFKEEYESLILEYSKNNNELAKRARMNLGRLHDAICKTEINIVEVKDETTNQNKNIDRVLNIFVRANDGGVKLEKSDLLLSFMESHRDLFMPKGARKEILDFVDKLNEVELTKPNYGFTKDDILKAGLMVTGLDIKYKIANFTSENLKKISDNWGNIKNSLNITVKLLAKYRFTTKSIVSKNALLPITYYIHHNELSTNFVDSTRSEDHTARETLMNWLIRAMISGFFGGSSDSTLEKVRKSIIENNKLPRLDSMDEMAIRELVDRESYGSAYSDLILKLITPINYWADYQQDHLHPQKQFSREGLEAINLNDDIAKKYKKKQNALGNICLLHPSVNNSKRGEPLSDWLQKQDDVVCKYVLIPENCNLDFGNFLTFVIEREILIVNSLTKVLGHV